MTARTVRPARRRKPPALTVHVGYQPAAPAVPGRRARPRDGYHAVADQPVTLGPLTRATGQALCGLPGPWPDPPPGLFPPPVTCPACRALAESGHITITGAP
ncbi:MAG: hypothetical protein ACR2FU_11190 [Streptosporangiaceae bacterium]